MNKIEERNVDDNSGKPVRGMASKDGSMTERILQPHDYSLPNFDRTNFTTPKTRSLLKEMYNNSSRVCLFCQGRKRDARKREIHARREHVRLFCPCGEGFDKLNDLNVHQTMEDSNGNGDRHGGEDGHAYEVEQGMFSEFKEQFGLEDDLPFYKVIKFAVR